MANMILGIFSQRQNAENAIGNLEDAGYNPKDISIIMKDSQDAQVIKENTGVSVASGAVSGATTGGVIGGIAGLLVGIGAIALPGLGALFIGGPLAAALGLTGAAASTVSGAATGALAGGLVGALMGIGIPEEDAKVYEQQIQSGAILIAVPVREGKADEARIILEENNADKIRTIAMRDTETKPLHV